MSNLYKVVDTSDKSYPIIDGIPFNKFYAKEELEYQLEKYFPNIFILEEISSRTGTSGMKESLLKCSFAPEETSTNNFYIYVFEIESGGRSIPTEHRIQIRTNRNWTPPLETFSILTNFCNEKSSLEEKECYVIGISKKDSDDHNVIFCSVHPDNIINESTNNIESVATSNKSIQVNVNNIRRAYIDGISYQKKEDNFIIIYYKPQYLLWYMRNRDELHLSDIQAVDSIIKDMYSIKISSIEVNEKRKHILLALKTKPFLLFAGISGTGKSRKVKELAYITCPATSPLAKDPTSPENYCLIEVKPNWHDSTELLGYYSNLNCKYDITPFIQFVYKASQNQDVPFFVCLDEMNLAPVEQYFAEYLSVLETRTLIDGKIESAELIKKEIFASCPTEKDGKAIYNEYELKILEYLKVNGLRLPENLFIIGTVNMDDTTHQFSRKVIDRAFTIEMNGDDLSTMFEEEDTLVYPETAIPFNSLKPKYVQAADALKNEIISPFKQLIIENVPIYLNRINEILKNTPFKVSFRVQNELVLYLSTLINEHTPQDDDEVKLLIEEATLVILLEKILPRVQGDEKLLGDTLNDLKKHIESNFNRHKENITYKEVVDKLNQMSNRLKSMYFANFF